MSSLLRLLFLLLLTFFLLLSIFFLSFPTATFQPPLTAHSPSLFPKSAIIALADDRSTFFLARPAAFGPELPEEGEEGGWSKGGGKNPGGDRTGGDEDRDRDDKRRGRSGEDDGDDWDDDDDDGPGLTGRLVAVDKDEDGCGDAPDDDEWETESLSSHHRHTKRHPSTDLDEKIVLIPRGGCGFLEKVMWAQNRGAMAVIIGDNVGGRGLVTMYAKGDTSNVSIPSVFTTHTTAQLLISLMPLEEEEVEEEGLSAVRRMFKGEGEREEVLTGSSNGGVFGHEDMDIKAMKQKNRGKGQLGSKRRQREGLWVTLTSTPGPANPFLDTLLVLVVSPLGTLGIVYTMLAIRARIQRRRWRAPKSIVESLPVRVYTTPCSSPVIQPQPSPPAPPPPPLLPAPASQPSQPAQQSLPSPSPTSGAQPSPPSQPQSSLQHKHQVPSSSLECVVCLEDYIPHVSRVMKLPCGHEFHVGCITPWLVTRRRTCPICKGDVVKMVREKGGYVPGDGDEEEGDLESGLDVGDDEEESRSSGSGGGAEDAGSGSGSGSTSGGSGGSGETVNRNGDGLSRWRRWVVGIVGGGRGRSVRSLVERGGDDVPPSASGGRDSGSSRNGTANGTVNGTVNGTANGNGSRPQERQRLPDPIARVIDERTPLMLATSGESSIIQ